MPLEQIAELQLPYKIIQDTRGFSLDFGGSVIKVTYIHKDNWSEAISKKTTAKVNLVTFPGTEFKDALTFIEKNVEVPREKEDETTEVFLTGVGCNFHKDEIETKLNVKIKLLPEYDCFIRSFIYLLKNIPAEQFVMEPSKEGYEKSLTKLDIMRETMRHYHKATDMTKKNLDFGNQDGTPMIPKADFQDLDDVFPCLLVMCGSAFAFFLVNKDGTYTAKEGSTRGGKTFLGLGSLLTGVQDFSEMISLAEKGNSRNVDTYPSDILNAQNNDTYAVFASKYDLPIYGFGKGHMATPEQFKKEDLLRALASHTCTDITTLAHLSANNSKAKSIFFCGSFVNAPLIRELMTAELNFKIQMAKMGDTSCKQFHFLKVGSHLGSLGAFFNVSFEAEKKKSETNVTE